MDDAEFEIQKALGLSIIVSCEIVYTLDKSPPFSEFKARDILFETFPGEGSIEHLRSLARKWLKAQYPYATFLHVSILYTIRSGKTLGKYHGPNHAT